MSGKVIHTRIIRSAVLQADIQQAIKCPECGEGECRLTFDEQDSGDLQRTMWSVACPCGCYFEIVWEGPSALGKKPMQASG